MEHMLCGPLVTRNNNVVNINDEHSLSMEYVIKP